MNIGKSLESEWEEKMTRKTRRKTTQNPVHKECLSKRAQLNRKKDALCFVYVSTVCHGVLWNERTCAPAWRCQMAFRHDFRGHKCNNIALWKIMKSNQPRKGDIKSHHIARSWENSCIFKAAVRNLMLMWTLDLRKEFQRGNHLVFYGVKGNTIQDNSESGHRPIGLEYCCWNNNSAGGCQLKTPHRPSLPKPKAENNPLRFPPPQFTSFHATGEQVNVWQMSKESHCYLPACPVLSRVIGIVFASRWTFSFFLALVYFCNL